MNEMLLFYMEKYRTLIILNKEAHYLETAFGAVDEPLAFCMIVHFTAHIA